MKPLVTLRTGGPIEVGVLPGPGVFFATEGAVVLLAGVERRDFPGGARIP